MHCTLAPLSWEAASNVYLFQARCALRVAYVGSRRARAVLVVFDFHWVDFAYVGRCSVLVRFDYRFGRLPPPSVVVSTPSMTSVQHLYCNLWSMTVAEEDEDGLPAGAETPVKDVDLGVRSLSADAIVRALVLGFPAEDRQSPCVHRALCSQSGAYCNQWSRSNLPSWSSAKDIVL